MSYMTLRRFLYQVFIPATAEHFLQAFRDMHIAETAVIFSDCKRSEENVRTFTHDGATIEFAVTLFHDGLNVVLVHLRVPVSPEQTVFSGEDLDNYIEEKARH